MISVFWLLTSDYCLQSFSASSALSAFKKEISRKGAKEQRKSKGCLQRAFPAETQSCKEEQENESVVLIRAIRVYLWFLLLYFAFIRVIRGQNLFVSFRDISWAKEKTTRVSRWPLFPIPYSLFPGAD